MRQRLRVMIVEDDPVVLALLRDYLASRGQDVTACGSLERARERLEGPPLDVALVDWILPEGSGLDMIREVREAPAHEDAFVMMLTVKHAPQDIRLAIQTGADDFLVKPVDVGVLGVRLQIAEASVGDRRRRREAERARHQADEHRREMMERTSRLASMGMLAAGVAHEINNPLQGIFSHLRHVRRAIPAGSGAEANLDMVERAMHSIEGLVRKLLEFGGRESDSEAGARCEDVVEFVLQLVRDQLEASDIEVAVESRTPGVSIHMPRQDLTQVLMNLVINARDAMPRGGILSLVCDAQGTEATIEVADTGPGIPEEIVEDIFAPFFTTKGTRGVGLGLSVAESIVRRADGRIEVGPSPGGGALFRVIAPRNLGSE